MLAIRPRIRPEASITVCGCFSSDKVIITR
jgi:hypothetical protein